MAGSTTFAEETVPTIRLNVSFKEKLHHGQYQDFHSGKSSSINANTTLQLAPWSYRIFTSQQ